MDSRLPHKATKPTPSSLLNLPKELRLMNFKFVVSSFTPSAEESDILISKRDFEQRCALFSELPLLHTCKLVRDEVFPMVITSLDAASLVALQDVLLEWFRWSDYTNMAARTLVGWSLAYGDEESRALGNNITLTLLRYDALSTVGKAMVQVLEDLRMQYDQKRNTRRELTVVWSPTSSQRAHDLAQEMFGIDWRVAVAVKVRKERQALFVDIVEKPSPESPVTTPSLMLKKLAPCRLLDLPKELRLEILELVICTSKPSIKAVPSSDELVCEHNFERRCVQFVEIPVLHTCKLLCREASPITDKALDSLAADLDTELGKSLEISEALTAAVDLTQEEQRLAGKMRLLEEAKMLARFGEMVADTQMAWKGRHRTVRKYRENGDCAGEWLHQRVPVADLAEIISHFAGIRPETIKMLKEEHPEFCKLLDA
ncbi:hypothetical protein B0A48_14923 [Cryoendolithus antarcticus]|uniref:Uncharacterized protein n=1 Tax=Cryoendolithus antarcticus TaxID=1507870 RepID=A0A1V8SIU6_9PEZI|nr:hypothetical protein B0A48_14923 [Cryoendolithus antarcticus]